MNQKLKDLRIFAEEIRIETLKEFKALGFGHVGGSMSVIEALSVLYGDIMKYNPKDPKMPDRDWLVMSKGHAGPALYATLALKGFMPIEQLQTLNKGGTNLPSHADRNKTPGIDMTTGSLGQGFSSAIGIALGNKISGYNNHTFLFIGDGECNEGQVWEGAMFAGANKLSSLICFVDYNKKQLDGGIDEIQPCGNFEEKFKSFGFNCVTVDGHNIEEIHNAVTNAYKSDRANCIILDTVKGKGCTIAENVEANHSITFTSDKIDMAIADAERVLAEIKG